jgi:type I restriction enzyme S subunit
LLLSKKASLESCATGSTFKQIKREDIGNLGIQLPPIAEQRRIAAILDQAEALRAKRREAMAKLNTLSQSMFLRLFGDPRQNPKRWPIARFNDVGDLQLGKMLDDKRQTGLNRKPYLRNANVQWHRFDLKDIFEMDFAPKEREKFRLRSGDVLICEGGEPGRAAVWQGEIEECYFQKALHRCRLDEKAATPDYISHVFWFLAKTGALIGTVTSATIAHLTAEKLREIRFPLPPVQMQGQFSQTIEKIAQQGTLQNASLAKLDALFASLQHRAFRGEL